MTNEACRNKDIERYHFHIGTLQQVMRKSYCPGCRLILSAARSTDVGRNAPTMTTIILGVSFLSAYHSERKDATGQWRSRWPNLPDDNRAESEVTPLPHVESIIEVVFDQGFSSLNEMVAGTIIRSIVEASADFHGSEFAMSQSKMQYLPRGRKVTSKVDIKMAEDWIHACDAGHTPCHLPTLPLRPDQDIRLIDVLNHSIVSATTAEKYVILSYVWGKDVRPVLVQDSVLQCSSLGGLRDLVIPRTISDAIQLVKDIGYRYLWVDSLCIVQDDNRDKQRQIPIMDSIYSNAGLVIIVAANSHASAGIPGIHHTQRRISQRQETIKSTQSITAQPSVQQVLEQSVWNTRGWTFQEAILSRRALVFTESLVYWNCQYDTWREDISSESPVYGLLLTQDNSIWELPQEIHTCRTRSYCELAERFSQRTFKDQGDVLWAFIGILRLNAYLFRDGFIWGHPHEILDSTLLWSEVSQCVGIHSRPACHADLTDGSINILPYPSWSWLSTNVQVSFKDPCGDSIISEVTWHGPFEFKNKTSIVHSKPVSSDEFSNRSKAQLGASILAGTISKSDVMSYGSLHFTAQTAVSTIRWADEDKYCNDDFLDNLTMLLEEAAADEAGEDPNKIERQKIRVDSLLGNTWAKATIQSPTEEEIGTLTVPIDLFKNGPEHSGELVLLSSNAEGEPDEICQQLAGTNGGNCKHVRGCKHVQSRNVMLIERDGNVAFRRGLGIVEKDGWDKIETEVKETVLN